jgi:hypothetical protein
MSTRHHSRQWATPCGCNEAQTSERTRLGCSSRERVGCSMTSGHCRERVRCDVGHDVLQKRRISCRFPSYWWPRLSSKPGPVYGNGHELGRESVLEWAHFLPSGDRAEGREKQDGRSFSDTIKTDANRLSVPSPSDVAGSHLLCRPHSRPTGKDVCLWHVADF